MYCTLSMGLRPMPGLLDQFSASTTGKSKHPNQFFLYCDQIPHVKHVLDPLYMFLTPFGHGVLGQGGIRGVCMYV